MQTVTLKEATEKLGVSLDDMVLLPRQGFDLFGLVGLKIQNEKHDVKQNDKMECKL